MQGQRSPRRFRTVVTLLATLALVLPATAVVADDTDPREGLDAGLFDAGEASENLELIESLPKPPGFFDEDDPGNFSFVNSDLAFTDNHVIMGSYNGFLIYDVNDPEEPELRTAVVCPGGQGDVSVSGDLLFVSVQQLGTEDCETLTGDDEPFLGVRVFDISDLDAPQQVAAVQTCRGSHTHTILEDPNDTENAYIYNHGTNPVRGDDPDGLDCVVGPTDDDGSPSNDPDDFTADTETSRFQIEIIKVPYDSPEDAAIAAEPRLFADEDGNPFGLEDGGPQGEDGQTVAVTDSCHDITVYPEIGLAAGACEGNGLLIDITDPLNPERLQALSNESYAYWHSATFNNDGTAVVFTDEFGGGVAPTCTPEVRDDFGANAIYDLVEVDGEPRLEFASFYKIPSVQTDQENCVAHNGSLLPVPGRDILVQAWYQGGISVMEFTDTSNPEEIAFFDRGPVDEDELVLGGHWSAYYYNGYIYGSEIARGLDVLQLTESEHLSAEELQQAADVRLRQFNPQGQPRITDADRSACAGVEPGSFEDIAGGLHEDNIACIAGYGIALGFGDGTFGPTRDVTRGQMATFLRNELRVAGVDLPDDPAEPFEDAGDTHGQAINQLAELGIISGTTATTYEPHVSISREQMATLIVGAVEAALGEDLPAPPSGFEDVGPDATHARSIDAAFEAGITRGTTQTTFSPRDDVRRGQMASFIAQSLEKLFYELVELQPIED